MDALDLHRLQKMKVKEKLAKSISSMDAKCVRKLNVMITENKPFKMEKHSTLLLQKCMYNLKPST